MPDPTPDDVLVAYSDFVQRCQNLTVSHRYSYPAAVHVRSAQELLDSARTLIDVLARFPAAVAIRPLPESREIATALRLAVPALLVHSGYVTPPLPALPVLLGQLTEAAFDLTAGGTEARLRDAGEALADISRSIADAQHTGTHGHTHALVRGVLRVSRRLLPFVTTATAVACAPLLLPVAGGITAAVLSVGTSVAGILLPSREELHNAFTNRPGSLTVPQAQLLTVAVGTALDEAEMCLRDDHEASRRDWARWAYQAADNHLKALSSHTGDPVLDVTRQHLAERAERIRAAIDDAPSPDDLEPPDPDPSGIQPPDPDPSGIQPPDPQHPDAQPDDTQPPDPQHPDPQPRRTRRRKVKRLAPADAGTDAAEHQPPESQDSAPQLPSVDDSVNQPPVIRPAGRNDPFGL
ncbi:hypothetical protein [Streptomyces sp. NPDC047042]|uniref:hypothetical protein n=1 Tax=Streptomyces sp. NPDC047042 TaxID=3154807 RepID=UPI0033F46B0F